MNPLRKERRIFNSMYPSPRATHEQVFGPRRGLHLSNFGLGRSTRPTRPTRPTLTCLPQLYEPYLENHYVAFDRKIGPIGYVGVYKGKHNCLYRFNYIVDTDYDGNNYLFKQVAPRNAIPESDINNTMIDMHFVIYHKDGTLLNALNSFIFLGRRNNALVFENSNYSTFSCEINEFDYELERDSEREIERYRESEERHARTEQRRIEFEKQRERELDEEKIKKMKEEQPSSNNGSNNSRTKQKSKNARAEQTLRLKGLNLNAMSNSRRKKLIKRAANYENAGSSESSPNWGSWDSPNWDSIEVPIPPMIRLNSNVSPITAAASYSLERAGVYPDDPNYGAKLETKRNQIRRRAEFDHGSSNENFNSFNRNDLRRRLGMNRSASPSSASPSSASRSLPRNSLPLTRKRFLRKMKANELMRKTIKKLLPRARARLRLRERSELRSEALRQARSKR
jgi:hypothetical protein